MGIDLITLQKKNVPQKYEGISPAWFLQGSVLYTGNTKTREKPLLRFWCS